MLAACARAAGAQVGPEDPEGSGGAAPTTAALPPLGGAAPATTSAPDAGAGGAPFEHPCDAVRSCATRASASTCAEYDSGFDELSVQAECGTSYAADACDPRGAVGACVHREDKRCRVVWYYPPTFTQSTLDALCRGLGAVVAAPPK